MSVNNSSTFNEAIDLFNSESNKLQDGITQSLKNFEKLSIREIINVYYQVINVISLAKFLRQNCNGIKNTEESKPLLIRLQEIEQYIDENFNRNLHLLIISNLKNSIENSMKKLKDMTANPSEKTKECELTEEEAVEIVNIRPTSLAELRSFTFGWKKLILAETLEKMLNIIKGHS